MEQADILKINMSVEEARKQIERLPKDHHARRFVESFASSLLLFELTPAQAQAVLVLAWNQALDWSRLRRHYPESEN